MGKAPDEKLRRIWLDAVMLPGQSDPRESCPGESIVIPEHPSQIRVVDVDLDDLRVRYLRSALDSVAPDTVLTTADVAFLAEETRWPDTRLQEEIDATRR